MVIETVPEDKAEVLIAQMRLQLGIGPATGRALLDAVQGPEAERVQAFLAMSVGKNDERGFKKFCPSCNDFTGHFVLPGSAWYLERCFRCRRIRAWRVVSPRLPPFGKAVVMPPGMDKKGILRMVLEVAGPEYVTRCVEVWMRKRVAERSEMLIHEMMEDAKLKAMEARLGASASPESTQENFTRL